MVGQNQGRTADRSQERPALCHRWKVSADKRCSQKVSKAHQILQGPTELKQRSRNNTCTPIAMNIPQRHMDLAGGYCGSVPVFVLWPWLSVCEIHIGYRLLSPSLSRENPQLMALVWCQRNTENTHRGGHSLSASWEGSENTHPNSVASSMGFFPQFLHIWAVFHSNTPCSKQPCYHCFSDSQQFQMSVPPSTETNTSPRAANNMYLIFYALFQMGKKKKKHCARKKKKSSY